MGSRRLHPAKMDRQSHIPIRHINLNLVSMKPRSDGHIVYEQLVMTRCHVAHDVGAVVLLPRTAMFESAVEMMYSLGVGTPAGPSTANVKRYRCSGCTIISTGPYFAPPP